MSPEFYFHDSFIPCSKWNNVLPYRMHNELGSDFICLSNSNSIEIYRVTTNTVVFHSRSNLMCNIAKMEVLPSKHQSSDYIFVIDEVGRWAIWRSTEG